jgi:methylenetetrahydrofolate dehydrogenase (NADP+)/methenyltetrahydrofolate cyclohydrolase
MTILDGKATAETIRREVAARVAAMVDGGARPPGLAVVLVGDDPASQVYVGSKIKACEEVGMVSRAVILPGATDAGTLRRAIDDLNEDDAIDGFLVQLPLPEHLQGREMVSRVAPEKDVDGFHAVNVGQLWLGEGGFAPATPSGIVELLQRYEIPIEGARAVIVGRSNIVGKPMAYLLTNANATVTVCHSRTADLGARISEADIVVAALGRLHAVQGAWIKPGAIVIDVGINRKDDGKLAGDVEFDVAKQRAAAITPVPGGVGPMTIASLLANTALAARLHKI